MTPQRQTRFSDVENGTHGNCFTACVASLFDKPIEDVPTFIDMGEDWFDAFLKYVYDQGHEFVGMYHLKPGEWPDDSGWGLFDGFMIAGGTSPRGTPQGHAVIYKHGKPFFDPHPSDAFLTEVEEFYAIKRGPAPVKVDDIVPGDILCEKCNQPAIWCECPKVTVKVDDHE